MAKTHKFKSNTGAGVTIYVTDPSGNSIPVRVEADSAYETDDKQFIDALKGSPEVRELKGKD